MNIFLSVSMNDTKTALSQFHLNLVAKYNRYRISNTNKLDIRSVLSAGI